MRIKSLLFSLVALLALVPLSHAGDSTVTLSDVHLCCKSCVNGANKTVATVTGATAVCDQAAGTIAITAPDSATLQKTVDALVKGGFYGKSSDASIKVSSETGAKGDKVTTLKVSGVHLCCPKCAKAVTAAVKGVNGVTGVDGVAKNAETFTVTGDFKDSDVFDALQKAGLTGTVAQ